MGLKDRAPGPDPAPERTVVPSEETADDAATDKAIKDAMRGYREKIEKDWDDMFPEDRPPKPEKSPGSIPDRDRRGDATDD